jgi:hypothetical protein
MVNLVRAMPLKSHETGFVSLLATWKRATPALSIGRTFAWRSSWPRCRSASISASGSRWSTFCASA